jgi:hypothetical protein
MDGAFRSEVAGEKVSTVFVKYKKRVARIRATRCL